MKALILYSFFPVNNEMITEVIQVSEPLCMLYMEKTDKTFHVQKALLV